MRRRDITVERMRELFDYDPLTGKFFQKVSGQKNFVPGSEVGHPNEKGYWYLSVDRLKVPCHRAAWALYYGEWPPGDIDHKDRDRGNNCINNLRPATISQNQSNTVRENAVGRRGVRIMKGKFQANIKHMQKQINLGTYETLDEASHAYNKKAIELFGDFAVLNPIGTDRGAAVGAGGQHD